jgi:hypothetical protein
MMRNFFFYLYARHRFHPIGGNHQNKQHLIEDLSLSVRCIKDSTPPPLPTPLPTTVSFNGKMVDRENDLFRDANSLRGL